MKGKLKSQRNQFPQSSFFSDRRNLKKKSTEKVTKGRGGFLLPFPCENNKETKQEERRKKKNRRNTYNSHNKEGWNAPFGE